MKNKYQSIFYCIPVVGLLIALTYTGSRVYPEVAGKVLTLCSSCLSYLLPILRTSLLSILFIAFASFLVSIIKTIQFSNRLLIVQKYPAHLKDLESKHALNDKIIVFDDNKPAAFCLGIIHPKIYVSNKLLSIMSNREIEAVILHERHHLRGFDNLAGIILAVITNTFFFFPIIGDIVNYIKIQIEIIADRNAVKVLGSNDSLVSALRKVIEYPTVSLATINAFSNGQDIDIRIHSLLKIKRARHPFSERSLFISLSLLLFAANFMVSKVEVHAQTQQETAVCFDKYSCSDSCQ